MHQFFSCGSWRSFCFNYCAKYYIRLQEEKNKTKITYEQLKYVYIIYIYISRNVDICSTTLGLLRLYLTLFRFVSSSLKGDTFPVSTVSLYSYKNVLPHLSDKIICFYARLFSKRVLVWLCRIDSVVLLFYIISDDFFHEKRCFLESEREIS